MHGTNKESQMRRHTAHEQLRVRTCFATHMADLHSLQLQPVTTLKDFSLIQKLLCTIRSKSFNLKHPICIPQTSIPWIHSKQIQIWIDQKCRLTRSDNNNIKQVKPFISFKSLLIYLFAMKQVVHSHGCVLPVAVR